MLIILDPFNESVRDVALTDFRVLASPFNQFLSNFEKRFESVYLIGLIATSFRLLSASTLLVCMYQGMSNVMISPQSNEQIQVSSLNNSSRFLVIHALLQNMLVCYFYALRRLESQSQIQFSMTWKVPLNINNYRYFFPYLTFSLLSNKLHSCNKKFFDML